MLVNSSTKVLSLDDCKHFYRLKLNKKLYQFITVDCGFPEYKQVNYLQSISEKNNVKKMKQGIQWKDDLVSRVVVVKQSIDTAKNIADVKAAYSSMRYTPPPFKL